VTADVVRRMFLNQYHTSGRYFVDLEELVCDAATTAPAQEQTRTVGALRHEDIHAAVNLCLRGDSIPEANVTLK
jgi:hypothetical protein